ncbi:asteroid protein [Planoprotostelium fungivorum]|uniref:Asteroid protein n=1 Tax=Planoprotostelium fungivorum TaxID=1890364 RepID=A0A2P6MZM2_9EUKA|nr:asteroid protein [Planoprotostelium fungivorum]
MGVGYLDTWLKNNGSCLTETVDLTLLSKETGERPVLVFDGDGLMYHLIHQIQHTPGQPGNYLMFAEATEKMIGDLREGGVDMRVLFDGTADESKLPTQVARARARVKDMRPAGDLLDRNLPPIYLKEYFMRLLRKHQVFVSCCSGEADAELSDYVVRNNFQAVVGKDTDFIILLANYVSLPDLQLRDGRVVVRQHVRSRTADYLKVPEAWLPLMACLIGNDTTKSGADRDKTLKSLDAVMNLRAKGDGYVDIVGDVIRFLREQAKNFPAKIYDYDYFPEVFVSIDERLKGSVRELLKIGVSLYLVKYSEENSLTNYPPSIGQALRDGKIPTVLTSILSRRLLFDRTLPLCQNTRGPTPSMMLETLRRRLYNVALGDGVLTEVTQRRQQYKQSNLTLKREGDIKTLNELNGEDISIRQGQFLSLLDMEGETLRGPTLLFCAAMRQILIPQQVVAASTRPLGRIHTEMLCLLHLIRSSQCSSPLHHQEGKVDLSSIRIELSSLLQYSIVTVDLLSYLHLCRSLVEDVEGELTDMTLFFDARDYNSLFTAYAGPQAYRKPRREKLDSLYGEEAGGVEEKMMELEESITRGLGDVFREETKEKPKKKVEKVVEVKKPAGGMNYWDALGDME